MNSSPPMDNPATKIDPIRDKYYRPLEIADHIVDALFLVAAVLSVVVPLVEKTGHPILYDALQTAFVVSVIAVCIGGITIRLHFAPRAQEHRYRDFLSHAFGVPLSHEQTTAYYTGTATDVPRRIGTQVLENSFYSRDTTSLMVWHERAKVTGYFLIWIVVILNRNTDLGLIAIGAQILFSEQIVSRWIRTEWAQIQFSRVFDDLFRLFQSKSEKKRFEVLALEILGRYEIAKSSAGITLSERIFKRRKNKADKEWEAIKRTLGL